MKDDSMANGADTPKDEDGSPSQSAGAGDRRQHEDGSGAAADGETRDGEVEPAPALAAKRVSFSLRAAVTAGVIIALVAGLGVMTWLYLGARSDAEALKSEAAREQRVEQVALDYAVRAAAMNFQDLNAWKAQLVEGTSPQLTEKLTKAADSMEQLLVPLEWTSTAEPLTAKVRSNDNGIYVVDTFVSVLTKTTQAPDSLQSTATYSITIDSNNDWIITDVGGIGAVVGDN